VCGSSIRIDERSIEFPAPQVAAYRPLNIDL
jgi:hypothetical protein